MIASKFVCASRHARWTTHCTGYVRVDHIVHTATLRSDIRGKHGPAPVSAWPIARKSGQFPASWSDCHFTTHVPAIVQSPAFRPERASIHRNPTWSRNQTIARTAHIHRPYPMHQLITYDTAFPGFSIIWLIGGVTCRKDPAGCCPAESRLWDRRFNPTCISKSSTMHSDADYQTALCEIACLANIARQAKTVQYCYIDI